MLIIGYILQLFPADAEMQALTDSPSARCRVPLALLYRILHDEIHIHRQVYDRKSIVVDHYEIGHCAGFHFDMEVQIPMYSLLITDSGSLSIRPDDTTSPHLIADAYSCTLLFCTPGHYRVSLGSDQQLHVVVSIAPDLFPLFVEDFAEASALVALPKDVGLYTLPTVVRDSVFDRRLEQLLYPTVARPKDYNLHLLQHTPRLLSAYKGLLRGKDQRSYDTQLLQDALAFIEASLQDGTVPSVVAVADRLCISHDKLGRLFRCMDTTPKRYIQQQCLTQLAYYLADTDIPLLALAEQFGYSDSNAMSKSFKAHYGVTPAHYRRQHR